MAFIIKDGLLLSSFLPSFSRTLHRIFHNFVKAILFLFIAFSSLAFADELRISGREFNYFRETAHEILVAYPPQEYFYVGLGRSPTILIAILKELAPGVATHLPGSTRRFMGSSLIGKSAESLKEHFERFLPSNDQLAGRKILLIDYIHNGASLGVAKDLINQLLPLASPCEALGLQADYQLFSDARINHILKVKLNRQTKSFDSEKYDNFSAYASVDLTDPNSLKNVRENPSYQLLVDRVRNRLSGCDGLLDSGAAKIASGFHWLW